GRTFLLVGDLMAQGPLAVLEVFGFHMQLAFRQDFTGPPHFSHAAGFALDLFASEDLAILNFHRPRSHEAGRGEIIIRYRLLFWVPDEDGLAAVQPLIDGMQ